MKIFPDKAEGVQDHQIGRAWNAQRSPPRWNERRLNSIEAIWGKNLNKGKNIGNYKS